MSYLEYFVYKIYKTYQRLYKRAPWLVYDGPENQAAYIAALHPTLLLFCLFAQLSVWKSIHSTTAQFITLVFLLLFCFILSSYFLKRLRKTRNRFSHETKKQRILGAIIVNVIIIICMYIYVITIKSKL